MNANAGSIMIRTKAYRTCHQSRMKTEIDELHSQDLQDKALAKDTRLRYRRNSTLGPTRKPSADDTGLLGSLPRKNPPSGI